VNSEGADELRAPATGAGRQFVDARRAKRGNHTRYKRNVPVPATFARHPRFSWASPYRTGRCWTGRSLGGPFRLANTIINVRVKEAAKICRGGGGRTYPDPSDWRNVYPGAEKTPIKWRLPSPTNATSSFAPPAPAASDAPGGWLRAAAAHCPAYTANSVSASTYTRTGSVHCELCRALNSERPASPPGSCTGPSSGTTMRIIRSALRAAA